MGYDVYCVALEAIKAAGSPDGAAIRDALPGVTYEGITGAISFNDIGDANRDSAVVKKCNTESSNWDFVTVAKNFKKLSTDDINHSQAGDPGLAAGLAPRPFFSAGAAAFTGGSFDPGGRMIKMLKKWRVPLNPFFISMEVLKTALPSGIRHIGGRAICAYRHRLYHGLRHPAAHQFCPRRCVHGGRPDDGLFCHMDARCIWRSR